METPFNAYQRLIQLLTPEDSDLLADALDAMRHASGGWGLLRVTVKQGRIDQVIIESSIRRGKKGRGVEITRTS